MTADDRAISEQELEEFYLDAKHATLDGMRAMFRRLKDENGITQDTIAHRSNLKRSAVSRIFRGLTNPTLRTLNAIARAMDCRIEIRWVALKDLRAPNFNFDEVAAEAHAASIFEGRIQSPDARLVTTTTNAFDVSPRNIFKLPHAEHA